MFFHCNKCIHQWVLHIYVKGKDINSKFINIPSSRVSDVLQSTGINSILFSFHCSGKYLFATCVHASLKLKHIIHNTPVPWYIILHYVLTYVPAGTMPLHAYADKHSHVSDRLIPSLILRACSSPTNPPCPYMINPFNTPSPCVINRFNTPSPCIINPFNIPSPISFNTPSPI